MTPEEMQKARRQSEGIAHDIAFIRSSTKSLFLFAKKEGRHSEEVDMKRVMDLLDRCSAILSDATIFHPTLF